MSLKNQIKQVLKENPNGIGAGQLADTLEATGYKRTEVQKALRTGLERGEVKLGNGLKLFEHDNPNATKQQLNG